MNFNSLLEGRWTRRLYWSELKIKQNKKEAL